MRTLILGTDFVYDKNGNLKPIEINTNTAWQYMTLEDETNKMDLSYFQSFVSDNKFKKIVYIGNIIQFKEGFEKISLEMGINFEFFPTSSNAITVPYIEDGDDVLIVRSSYDTTAIVDSTYCANKVNFLNLIKDSHFGSEFAYINSDGQLINNIKNINDNGQHPNFILKAVDPTYDKSEYPKLYKVKNNEELEIVLKNVDSEHFLMEYHFNNDNLYQGNQITVTRTFNMIFPPSLNSIHLASYTTLSSQKLYSSEITYDSNTLELTKDKHKYISTETDIRVPKLLDDDMVEMFDGTYKKPAELNIGDYVKTIDIPNPENVDYNNRLADFKITWEEFKNGIKYTKNRITNKEKVDRLVNYMTITFEDGSDWKDTEGSSYLINRDDNIRFAFLGVTDHASSLENLINPGDKIVLIDTSKEIADVVEKKVTDVKLEKTIFSGWIIEVERRHLFLTKSDKNTSYVTIEHNATCTTANNTCVAANCTDKSLFCTTNLNYPCGGSFRCNCKSSCFVPKL